MNISIVYRKLFSISLITVFIGILMIQTADVLYMHHDHDHISCSHELTNIEGHEYCPIYSFEFVNILDVDNQYDIAKQEFMLDYYSPQTQNVDILLILLAFDLRAHPELNSLS